MKDFIKTNLVSLLRVLAFFVGAGLMWLDHSGGYITKMGILSFVGIALMIGSIGFQWILGLFAKKK